MALTHESVIPEGTRWFPSTGNQPFHSLPATPVRPLPSLNLNRPLRLSQYPLLKPRPRSMKFLSPVSRMVLDGGVPAGWG